MGNDGAATAVAVLGLTAALLLVIALFVAWPIFLIWALNTLFGLEIPVTLKTWTAAFILVALTGQIRYRSSPKKGE